MLLGCLLLQLALGPQPPYLPRGSLHSLCPGNFLLLSDDPNARLKAIDFGLAVFFEEDKLPRTDLGLEGTPWCVAAVVLLHSCFSVLADDVLCSRLTCAAAVLHCAHVVQALLPVHGRHGSTTFWSDAVFWPSVCPLQFPPRSQVHGARDAAIGGVPCLRRVGGRRDGAPAPDWTLPL